MKIKINSKGLGHPVGATIDVEDIDGIPTDRFWRRRLRDSIDDGCCEIVEPKKTGANNAANEVK